MKKNCHHQRPERKQKLYKKGHQGQEEQQEDPSVMKISLRISRGNSNDVKLYSKICNSKFQEI